MKNIKILILEDDLETVEKILFVLRKIEEEIQRPFIQKSCVMIAINFIREEN